MSIYENFISDEELKSIVETQEIKYKMDCNELIAQGMAQGIAQGIVLLFKAKQKVKLTLKLKQFVTW